ncbi:hypothetical protein [Streptomyces sp. NPDC088258]|uniref:hypothetical protein n=1 Tax=Streptomyces sp. NPDC088258 TaxID=3365849 RepID=UPI003810F89D
MADTIRWTPVTLHGGPLDGMKTVVDPEPRPNRAMRRAAARTARRASNTPPGGQNSATAA